MTDADPPDHHRIRPIRQARLRNRNRTDRRIRIRSVSDVAVDASAEKRRTAIRWSDPST